MRIFLASLIATALGCVFAEPVASATLFQTVVNDPGDSCQLSIPTTDTKVRPKATGYRNEGSSGTFVICGFGGAYPDGMIFAKIHLMSLDGATRPVSCTFVSGGGVSPASVVYVTKIVDASTSGLDFAYLDSSDFGGPPGLPVPNTHFSVTCNLPPQMAITHLRSQSILDSGT